MALHSKKLTGIAAIVLGCVATLASCRTTQPASEQVSDSWITAKIKSKYVADSDISAFNISVTTEEGVVYLIGRVSEPENKQEAEAIARDTEGVKSVVNHIEVGDTTDND